MEHIVFLLFWWSHKYFFLLFTAKKNQLLVITWPWPCLSRSTTHMSTMGPRLVNVSITATYEPWSLLSTLSCKETNRTLFTNQGGRILHIILYGFLLKIIKNKSLRNQNANVKGPTAKSKGGTKYFAVLNHTLWFYYIKNYTDITCMEHMWNLHTRCKNQEKKCTQKNLKIKQK